ncbi:hypothetical protein D1872_342500 [compost metagenome]
MCIAVEQEHINDEKLLSFIDDLQYAVCNLCLLGELAFCRGIGQVCPEADVIRVV